MELAGSAQTEAELSTEQARLTERLGAVDDQAARLDDTHARSGRAPAPSFRT